MASNYEQLVKALRCCISNPPETCVGCTYNIGNNECAVRMMMHDAAAAIEDMAKHITEMHERVTVLQIDRGHLETEMKEWRRLNNENLLPKRRQPHWVSVFDDLPRHNAVVVVSDGKRSWDVGQYHFLFKADDRTIWWWKKHTTRKVLWWMYKEDALPQPPQEVQE